MHVLKWFNKCCKEEENEKKKNSKQKNKKKKTDEESELELEEEQGSESASESVAMTKNKKKMRINSRAVKQEPKTTQPTEAAESIEADVSPSLDNSMTFNDDKTDEDEDDRSESEASHGSESEESKEAVPKTKNKNKSRKKRRNGYKAVEQAPITTQPMRTSGSIQVSVCPQIQNKMIFNGFSGIPQLTVPSASPGIAVSKDIPTVQSIVEWVPSTIEKASELINKAVVGGYDIDESDLWIIKARLKCEEIPGKLNHYHSLAFVAHKKPNGEYAERNVEVFEVLCINPEAKERIRWTKCSNGVVPGNAIEGGRKHTGEILYIGRQRQDDENIPGRYSLCPGMIQPSHKVLYVTYDFKVYAHQFYEVLCID